MRGRLSRYAGAVAIAMVLAGIGAQPAAASDDRHGPGGHQHERQYLALGDSVPFGFSPLVNPPNPANYVGYPEKAAPPLGLALTNGSCPGQSSAGFISLSGSDNGCNAARAQGFPLHTAYAGTQLDFAVSYLRSHPSTRLVTISLGANDLILCADASTDQCASQLPTVLKEYEKNLKKILKAIRKVYNGKLVAVTYYSPDYRDAVTTGSLAAINAVETRVIHRFRGTTADGFAAFAAVAARFGNDTCRAGLLIPLPTGGCDVHPSEAGAQLLADTLTATVSCDRRYVDQRNREDSLQVGATG